MNPRDLGGGLAGLTASRRHVQLRTWGLRVQRMAGPGSEGQLLDPLSVWAGTTAALHRTSNVCAVVGSYLVFGSQGLQIKLYG